MAPRIVRGILGDGDEDDKAAVEEHGSELRVDAFAAAVAARQSASDPEVARETSAFLKKQAQLLETQNKHLEDEHALRLSHLRGQSLEGKLRRTGMRLRLAFLVFVQRGRELAPGVVSAALPSRVIALGVEYRSNLISAVL